MKSIPIEHPISVDAASRKILKRLWDLGFVTWVVGGAIRDHLLGRAPKDLDWVTDCPLDELDKTFPEALPIGRNFGVFLIPKEGGGVLEIATFRKDGVYTDGRHPNSISQGTPEEDALRRDFSINAIYYDPKSQRLIDYVNGIDDLLDRKILRAIGSPEVRFQEDSLRILRGIRFASHLNLRFDETTLKDLSSSVRLLKKLSGERIQEEFLKALCHPKASLVIKRYFEIGVMPQIFAHDLSNTEAAFEFASPWISKATPGQVFSILFSHLARKGGATALQSVSDRLKLAKSVAQEISDFVLFFPKLNEVFEMRTPSLMRWVNSLDFPKFRDVAEAYLFQNGGNVLPINFLNSVYLNAQAQQQRPKVDFRGEDLVSLGFQPGPIFSDILDVIEDQILEGKITTKEEAFDFVMRVFGEDSI